MWEGGKQHREGTSKTGKKTEGKSGLGLGVVVEGGGGELGERHRGGIEKRAL